MTIAMMPALRASGNVGQAALMAARSGSASAGSKRVAFWVAVEGRFESVSVGSRRDNGVECSWLDEACDADKQGFKTLPVGSVRVYAVSRRP